MSDRTEGGRSAWIGRIISYGLVIGLVLVTVAGIERWPVTSFRLFSTVRTDRSFVLELVAIEPDGTRQRVPISRSTKGSAGTAHQLGELRAAPPAEQRAKVTAWMNAADMDLDRFELVALERVERRLDPDGGPPLEVRRAVVLEVVP